jgi:hypothetical protein
MNQLMWPKGKIISDFFFVLGQLFNLLMRISCTIHIYFKMKEGGNFLPLQYRKSIKLPSGINHPVNSFSNDGATVCPPQWHKKWLFRWPMNNKMKFLQIFETFQVNLIRHYPIYATINYYFQPI